ncbi:MAG TPA: metallophosphoesterase [Candidatus Binatia bacterium]|jgi:hypothetical protein
MALVRFKRAFWRSFFRLVIFTAALAEWICLAWVAGVMLAVPIPWFAHLLGPVGLHLLNRRVLGSRPGPAATRRTPFVRAYVGVVFTCLFGMIALLVNAVLWAAVAVVFAVVSHMGASLSPADVLWPAQVTGSVALLVVSALLAWGYGPGQRAVRVLEVEVPVHELPSAFDGFRIAQISDIHLGGFMDEERLAAHIEHVNSLGADLICITGDITDGLDHAPRTFPVLGRLAAPDGVIAILGNHDFYTGADAVTAALCELTSIRVLRDESVALEREHSRLHILGVDDAGVDWTRGVREHRALPALIEAIPDGETRILLSHRPELFHQAISFGISLTLSGHTHGGQIAVPWPLRRPSSLARFISDFPRGTYRVNGSVLHVNLGLGVTGQPVRLFSPREITLITLRRAQPGNEGARS